MAITVTNLLAAAIAILIVFLIKKYVEWRIYVRKINLLPGPKCTWPFGSGLPFLFSSEEDYMGVYHNITDTFNRENKNATLMRLWVFCIPYIAINKAATAETVLKSTTEIKKANVYTFLKEWLGQGLLTSTGSKWHSRRKLLTPSFHFQILDNFVAVFNEQSQILVDQLSKVTNKGTFDISPYISRCTLDIICDSAMGKKIDAQTQLESQYVNAVILLSDITLKKAIYVWRAIPFIYAFFPDKRREEKCLKLVHDFTNRVIRERRAERARQKSAPSNNDSVKEDEIIGKKKRKAFLDTLLETIENGQGSLTNEEIREEVDTFMFEGHDTTASGLTSAIMHLALNPEVQEKAFEEITSIYGESDRPVEMADFTKMKYLEAVIKETLRLNPPVPLYGRQMINDCVVDGYTFPKGVSVLVNVRSIHRDPSLYKNPNDFDPTRFLKDNSEADKHPYSFVAFSAGPRNCIGQKFAMMEEKVVLTYLLRNYKISGTWTEEQAKMSLAIVTRPLNGVQVSLTKRTRH